MVGEQSSGVKLAEKPGLVGFAVPFGAIKRRKALSHVGRELFRAIVLPRPGCTRGYTGGIYFDPEPRKVSETSPAMHENL